MDSPWIMLYRLFAAAAAGSLLAVCSCTIVPLFAGISTGRIPAPESVVQWIREAARA